MFATIQVGLFILVCLISGSLAGYHEKVGFNHCQCSSSAESSWRGFGSPYRRRAPLLSNCIIDGQRLQRLFLSTYASGSLRGNSASTYSPELAILGVSQVRITSFISFCKENPICQKLFHLQAICLIKTRKIQPRLQPPSPAKYK